MSRFIYLLQCFKSFYWNLCVVLRSVEFGQLTFLTHGQSVKSDSSLSDFVKWLFPYLGCLSSCRDSALQREPRWWTLVVQISVVLKFLQMSLSTSFLCEYSFHLAFTLLNSLVFSFNLFCCNSYACHYYYSKYIKGRNQHKFNFKSVRRKAWIKQQPTTQLNVYKYKAWGDFATCRPTSNCNTDFATKPIPYWLNISCTLLKPLHKPQLHPYV